MIYINTLSSPQSVYIPKGERQPIGSLRFKAESTIDLFSFEMDVIDLNLSSLYHYISISYEDQIPSGEYKYELSDEKGVLSCGLLIIGESKSPIEYTNETEYEQYEN